MINVTKETFDEFMIEIGKAPLLTPEQESLYIKQAQQGSQRAMQAICNANMRFVVSVANVNKGDLDIISAIHIAEPGLTYAVKTYDTASEIKFHVYAVECMKECFKKSSRRLKITKTITERNTTESEHMNEQGEITMPHLRLYDFEHVDEVMDISSIQSLKEMADAQVQEKLSCLTNREREVMQMLIGYGCASMTVNEVADHFELLPLRIRQIRDKALKKINSAEN